MEGIDDFIGQRFGEEGQLEVLALSVMQGKGASKRYKVFCHKCAKDCELHGSAEYDRYKSDITSGKMPCGCSPSPRYSEKQMVVIISRECKQRGYLFLGFSGNYIGNKTKLKLECLKDGNVWESTTIQSFINGCNGCPECRNIGNSKLRKLPDEVMIRKFMATGKYPENTLFTRSKRKGKTNGVYWDVSCPICSQDEYVKSGLCDGIFTALAGDLKGGKIVCRCARNHSPTLPQLEFNINKTLTEEGSEVKFIKWVSTFTKSHNNVIRFSCNFHGEWDTSYASFSNGSRCPQCAKHGFNKSKDGGLYVLKVVGQENSFTGYGISCDPTYRLKVHKRNLAKQGLSILDYVVFNTTGVLAYEIESMIKDSFELAPQSIEGFKQEATHFNNFDFVVSFINDNLLTLSSKVVEFA